MLRDTTNAVDISTVYKHVTKPKPEPFTRPKWFDDPMITASGYNYRCRCIVRDFLLGKIRNGEKIISSASQGRHVYSTKNNGTELWLFKDNPSVKVSVCVAKKVSGIFVGNSSSITFMRTAQGKKKGKITAFNSGPLKIQEALSETMPMVPFQMFKEAQMDIDTLKIIEKGPDEKLIGKGRRGAEDVHFTGALLFSIEFNKRSKGLRGNDEYFLFDIDRNDIKLKNINYFLSKLNGRADSISEAYEKLKPKEVSDAERFMKEPCPRQGEWFFIPVPGRHRRKTLKHQSPALEGNGFMRFRKTFQEGVLQSNGNRAHFVKFLSEDGFVTGKVWHAGWDHTPIVLKGWHKPVPNTAIGSFKISGAVD